ncbi:MAG TPA: HDOD domain-containing protein [Macromonas sp.]|nr:HDOD domain-containing protein [Macromonas sp.]
MFGWLNRFIAMPQRRPVPPRPVQAPLRPAPAASVVASDPNATAPVSTWSWLLGVPPPTDTPLQNAEQAVLDLLQATVAKRVLPAYLMPLASSVVPPLLRLLRQPNASRREIVARVSRDQALKAEVLRLAQSAFYRTEAEVDSLEAAVMVLGTSGLQAAIARVVLKPIFDNHKGDLTSRASARAWRFADHQAECCAQLAEQAGIQRSEGFLAGTLHSMGRTAVLRVLDRASLQPDWPCSLALDQAMNTYSDQLFGRLVMDLQITPVLTETGRLLGRHGRVDEAGGLAAVLRESETQTTQALLRQDSAGQATDHAG